MILHTDNIWEILPQKLLINITKLSKALNFDIWRTHLRNFANFQNFLIMLKHTNFTISWNLKNIYWFHINIGLKYLTLHNENQIIVHSFSNGQASIYGRKCRLYTRGGKTNREWHRVKQNTEGTETVEECTNLSILASLPSFTRPCSPSAYRAHV